MRYLRSPNKSVYVSFKNIEDGVGTIFSFSLYTASLQVTLVVYFRRELKEL